jgi:isocitrate/isopropylmalate dehydrogenase
LQLPPLTSLPVYQRQENNPSPSIAGDGIGTEVIGAGIQVLEFLSEAFQTFFTYFPRVSSAYYKQHGHYIPPDDLEVTR